MTITASGYIIQDTQGYAINGIGETVDDAWANTIRDAGPFFYPSGTEKPEDVAFIEDFQAYGATAALLASVRENGGSGADISWDIVGGVACTADESEAARP